MTVSSVTGWIKTRLIVILSLLVLLSGGFGYFAYSQWRKSVREAEIWENNYLAEKQGHIKTVIQKELEIDQILEDKRIDSAVKAEGIKKKEVRYVYITKYRDTGSATVQIEYRYPDDKWAYPITSYYEENCYTGYWTYYPNGDSATHQWNIETDIQGTVFERREKEFKLFKWIIFRYGDKKAYLTVTDHCNNKEIISNQHIKVKR